MGQCSRWITPSGMSQGREQAGAAEGPGLGPTRGVPVLTPLYFPGVFQITCVSVPLVETKISPPQDSEVCLNSNNSNAHTHTRNHIHIMVFF